MRKQGLEKLSITGKMEGRRALGRQRITFLTSLRDWTGVKVQDLLGGCDTREKWNIMVADALKGHGT